MAARLNPVTAEVQLPLLKVSMVFALARRRVIRSFPLSPSKRMRWALLIAPNETSYEAVNATKPVPFSKSCANVAPLERTAAPVVAVTVPVVVQPVVELAEKLPLVRTMAAWLAMPEERTNEEMRIFMRVPGLGFGGEWMSERFRLPESAGM